MATAGYSLPFRPLLSALLAAALCCGCALFLDEASGAPSASGGVLDLRAWDFGRRGPAPLVGEWDFFPGRLLSGAEALSSAAPGRRRVPDRWKGGEAGGEAGRGAGTYRLRVLLPESLADPALRYTTVSTAFEFEANGALVARAGRPALDPREATPSFAPDVVALPRSGELVLVARVSNHEYRAGGLWRAFTVGPASVQEARAVARRVVAWAECAALAALALSFAFFFRYRPGKRIFVSFALLSLSIALRALVTGEYALVRVLPGLGFEALIRLEYLTVFLPAPFSLLFFAGLFPEQAPRKWVAALVVPSFALAAILVPFAPLPLLTRSVYAAYALLAATAVFVAAAILAPALAHRRADAALELVGGLILAAAGANDALFSSFVLRSGNLFPLGLLVFVGIQTYVLARRYGAALAEAEALSAEKDLLLREVNHRVKNSLQIISSAIALQAHRSSDPAVVAALDSARARIRALGLAHEQLFAIDSTGPVDAAAYALDLGRRLGEGFGLEGPRLEFETGPGPMPAGPEVCLDLGLAISELLSNACRHARAQGEGRVRMSLRLEGSDLVLLIRDDGPGFPHGFSPDSSSGLGLKVVSSLARKRGGSLSCQGGPGAAVEFRLPIPEPAAKAAPSRRSDNG